MLIYFINTSPRTLGARSPGNDWVGVYAFLGAFGNELRTVVAGAKGTSPIAIRHPKELVTYDKKERTTELRDLSRYELVIHQ